MRRREAQAPAQYGVPKAVRRNFDAWLSSWLRLPTEMRPGIKLTPLQVDLFALRRFSLGVERC